MRPGVSGALIAQDVSRDWICRCGRKNKAEGTKGEAGGDETRSGDWTCPVCDQHNFAYKYNCNRGLERKGFPRRGV
ncbi:hypothetical protein EMIHUDRAFT_236041 [Emiliania huxleyi CCMP1516]|uniref:RanBP2-type domain-containing protein n=2 Tax=Emiliania huxleyi TaxID=2903 RepID=A0A0D3JUX3_EMIH1|nr:hypothetical protein EMIHUDRAFT_236041 [Emiliania huxleyi CCMP1516]EOD27308.1 hypothetical protein EMIHUDRAFT_236041 [Emiliania huxleyi CCMP1516]|eukprot:XP_005779737.1 hypothetical protein EMIHUDRAFT_236041 [Emiliania huxleyi CCMP1516]